MADIHSQLQQIADSIAALGKRLRKLEVRGLGSAGSMSEASGHRVQEEGSSLPQRPVLNFVGDGLTASDDSGTGSTVVSLDRPGHIIQDWGTSRPQRKYLNFEGDGTTVVDNSGTNASVVQIKYPEGGPGIDSDVTLNKIALSMDTILVTGDNGPFSVFEFEASEAGFDLALQVAEDQTVFIPPMTIHLGSSKALPNGCHLTGYGNLSRLQFNSVEGDCLLISEGSRVSNLTIFAEGTGTSETIAVAARDVALCRISRAIIEAWNSTKNIAVDMRGLQRNHGPVLEFCDLQTHGGTNNVSLRMDDFSFALKCTVGAVAGSSSDIALEFIGSGSGLDGPIANFMWLTGGQALGSVVGYGLKCTGAGRATQCYIVGYTNGVFIPPGGELSVYSNEWSSILCEGSIVFLPGDLTPPMVFNVKTYGAVGDGIANDTQPVQKALDEAAVYGGTVWLPSGSYLCDPLTFYYNISLSGSSGFGSALKSRSSGNLLTLSGGGDFLGSIRDMVFYGQGVGTTGLFVSEGNLLNLERVQFLDFVGNAVEFSGVISSHFSGCLFYNCESGVYAHSGTILPNYLSFSECDFKENTHYGIYWTDGTLLSLDKCRFRRNGTVGNPSYSALYVAMSLRGFGFRANGCLFEESRGGADISIESQDSTNVISVLSDSIFIENGDVSYGVWVNGVTTPQSITCKNVIFNGDATVADFFGNDPDAVFYLENCLGTIGGTGTFIFNPHEAVTVSDTSTIDLTITDQLLSADLKDTAVTPGSYAGADITVDAQGRLTSAAKGAQTAFKDESNTFTQPQLFPDGTVSSPGIAFSANTDVGIYRQATESGGISFAVDGYKALTVDKLTNAFQMTLGDGSIRPLFRLDGPSGTLRSFAFYTGGVLRWQFSTDNSAESGSNSGSNFGIQSRSDDGVTSNNRMVINRANGVVTIQTGLIVNESGAATTDFRVESDTEDSMILVDSDADTDGALYLGGATNAVKVQKGGDVKFVGSGAGLCYGSFGADDASIAVVVTTADVYYGVDSGMTVGNVHNMTFQNSRELRVDVAGKYLVTWSMSVKAGNNDHLEGAIMINTTAVAISSNAGHTPGPGDEIGIAGTAIVSVAVNDLIKLCVQNETDADDITVTHASLSAMQVGS